MNVAVPAAALAPDVFEHDLSDRKFRVTPLSLVCLIVASLAVALCLGKTAGKLDVATVVCGAGGSALTLGLIVGIIAILVRRLLKQSNATANTVFSVGVAVWAGLACIGVLNKPRPAQAGEFAPPASEIASPVTQPPMSPALATILKPSSAPPPKPLSVAEQQAVYARRSFMNADGYLMEKSLAKKVAGLLDEGKPWVFIDGMTEKASAEFRSAYASWRSAEVRAGRDVKVSASEIDAIQRLKAIRQAIGQFRAKNNRPPALSAIASLPPNPFTGQRGVAKSGSATKSHGWSYDESAGRIRIVLPRGKYAGLADGEIETI